MKERKVFKKTEILKRLDREIKVGEKELKKTRDEQYSYEAGALESYKWIRFWIENDFWET